VSAGRGRAGGRCVGSRRVVGGACPCQRRVRSERDAAKKRVPRTHAHGQGRPTPAPSQRHRTDARGGVASRPRATYLAAEGAPAGSGAVARALYPASASDRPRPPRWRDSPPAIFRTLANQYLARSADDCLRPGPPPTPTTTTGAHGGPGGWRARAPLAAAGPAVAHGAAFAAARHQLAPRTIRAPAARRRRRRAGRRRGRLRRRAPTAEPHAVVLCGRGLAVHVAGRHGGVDQGPHGERRGRRGPARWPGCHARPLGRCVLRWEAMHRGGTTLTELTQPGVGLAHGGCRRRGARRRGHDAHVVPAHVHRRERHVGPRRDREHRRRRAAARPGASAAPPPASASGRPWAGPANNRRCVRKVALSGCGAIRPSTRRRSHRGRPRRAPARRAATKVRAASTRRTGRPSCRPAT